MIDLNALLPKLLRTEGANAELAVKLAWSRASGTGLRRQAIPLRLEGRTLVVAVADAIWQKQLQHMSQEIIFRMNKLLGKPLVDSIRFEVKPSALSGLTLQERADDLPRATAPTEIIFAAQSIGDEDLRQRFIRAVENCIARRDANDDNGN